MNVAVIDIGTNTVLLLVARFDREGRITPVVYEQRVPRLGRGVDAQKLLAPDAMERTVHVLQEYRGIIAQHDCAATVVCGTSAVRDAANRDVFAQRVRERTGMTLEILGGADEAHWTYRGAVSGAEAGARTTVLDIGGGSTEITTGDGHAVYGAASVDIGSVRLTERFFSHDPPLAADTAAAHDAVRSALGQVHLSLRGSMLVAVAGTATTLALLAQRRKAFDIAAVAGYRMTHRRVHDLRTTLSRTPSADLRRIGEFMEGRSDIIAAGALILDEVMEGFGFAEVAVSERGVRYGLAIREWERLRPGGSSA